MVTTADLNNLIICSSLRAQVRTLFTALLLPFGPLSYSPAATAELKQPPFMAGLPVDSDDNILGLIEEKQNVSSLVQTIWQTKLLHWPFFIDQHALDDRSVQSACPCCSEADFQNHCAVWTLCPYCSKESTLGGTEGQEEDALQWECRVLIWVWFGQRKRWTKTKGFPGTSCLRRQCVLLQRGCFVVWIDKWCESHRVS